MTKLAFVLISTLTQTALGQADPTAKLVAVNAEDSRLDLSLVGQVYDYWVREEQDIASGLNVFHQIATDIDRTVSERAKSYLTTAHFYWQYGDHSSALNSVEAALALKHTTDGTLLKARLLDAQGKESDAAEWYRKSSETTDRLDEQEFLQIRLTMIQVDHRNIDALMELARIRDQQFKNRASIVLALLG